MQFCNLKLYLVSFSISLHVALCYGSYEVRLLKKIKNTYHEKRNRFRKILEDPCVSLKYWILRVSRVRRDISARTRTCFQSRPDSDRHEPSDDNDDEDKDDSEEDDVDNDARKNEQRDTREHTYMHVIARTIRIWLIPFHERRRPHVSSTCPATWPSPRIPMAVLMEPGWTLVLQTSKDPSWKRGNERRYGPGGRIIGDPRTRAVAHNWSRCHFWAALLARPTNGPSYDTSANVFPNEANT